MGGFGSGNWNRDINAKLIDQFTRFDVYQFVGKKGYIFSGDPTGVLAYNLDGLGVELLPVTEDVPHGIWIKFDYTKTNYGGERRWLVCPYCNQRRGALYISKRNVIACRVCLGLRYPSQYGNHAERLMRCISKIEWKLLSPCNGRGKGKSITTLVNQLNALRSETYRLLKKIERGESVPHN